MVNGLPKNEMEKLRPEMANLSAVGGFLIFGLFYSNILNRETPVFAGEIVNVKIKMLAELVGLF